MSALGNLIPGRNRGKHDPETVIGRLQHDNATLLNRQAEADDFFAILLHDVNEEKQRRLQAEKTIRQLEAVIRLRDQQIDDLIRKLEVGVNAEHVIAKTQAMDADEIRAHCAKPVPLHQSPMAIVTDTGRGLRATSWGRDVDDTRPLPRMREAS
jgi:hypothetical protein